MDWGHALGTDWLGRALAAGCTAVLTALAGVVAGRKQVQSNIRQEADAAVKVACDELRALVGTLSKEIGRLRKDQETERLQCDRKLAGLQNQINELMARPVAPYGDEK